MQERVCPTIFPYFNKLLLLVKSIAVKSGVYGLNMGSSTVNYKEVFLSDLEYLKSMYSFKILSYVN